VRLSQACKAGSLQLFKKFNIFPQQLIDHIADILAFPTSNPLEFALEFRL
jgi:hypothetical protein